MKKQLPFLIHNKSDPKPEEPEPYQQKQDELMALESVISIQHFLLWHLPKQAWLFPWSTTQSERAWKKNALRLTFVGYLTIDAAMIFASSWQAVQPLNAEAELCMCVRYEGAFSQPALPLAFALVPTCTLTLLFFLTCAQYFCIFCHIFLFSYVWENWWPWKMWNIFPTFSYFTVFVFLITQILWFHSA